MAVVVVVVCTAHCSNCNLEGFNFLRFEFKDIFACFKLVYRDGRVCWAVSVSNVSVFDFHLL